MAETPVPAQPALPVGQTVTAWGHVNSRADDPEAERPGPFTGELRAVKNPFTGRTDYFVEANQVDPATVKAGA